MKRTVVSLLTLALVFAFAGGALAHIDVEGSPFLWFELTDEELAIINVRDGSIEDWDSLFEPSLYAPDFYADPDVGQGLPYDPAILDYRIWLGWTRAGRGNHLYLAIERIDAVYVNEYEGGAPGQIWQYDSIEFMVDGDHSGGQYGGWEPEFYDTEEELLLIDNAQAQQYVAIAVTPDDQHIGYLGAGTGWVIRPPFADAGGAAWGADPNISVIEMYVTPFDNCIWNDPDNSVVSTLEPDRIIGFQISVPDFDVEPRAYTAFHTLSGQGATFKYAERFVDGVLVGADIDPTDPTAVQSSSWADIKSSFAE